MDLADNLHSTGLCCRNVLVVICKAVNEVVEKFDFVNTRLSCLTNGAF